MHESVASVALAADVPVVGAALSVEQSVTSRNATNAKITDDSSPAQFDFQFSVFGGSFCFVRVRSLVNAARVKLVSLPLF